MRIIFQFFYGYKCKSIFTLLFMSTVVNCRIILLISIILYFCIQSPLLLFSGNPVPYWRNNNFESHLQRHVDMNFLIYFLMRNLSLKYVDIIFGHPLYLDITFQNYIRNCSYVAITHWNVCYDYNLPLSDNIQSNSEDLILHLTPGL